MSSSETILFLEPVFKERIWGGDKLATYFGFTLPSNHTGECWAISAHPHGDCKIKNGQFAGEHLSDVFDSHPELFGNTLDAEFPLLVKVLDAADDLSVQVHPNDEYAGTHEGGSLGKRECWYVIDCKPDASIVVGQRATSREELKDAIEAGTWSDILIEVPIKPGDFFQIEPGCVHALKGGTLILETQQSSDITYRLYDYDRKDAEGKTRELHIDKALDVIDYAIHEPNRGQVQELDDALGHTLLEENDSYTVELLKNTGTQHISSNAPYVLVTAIAGEGTICGKAFKKGESCILVNNPKDIEVTGSITMILSHV